jgi:hypothetical protein
MPKPSLPANVSRWELAGVSALPIVEVIFSLDLHTALGLSAEQMISVLAALMTALAIARAVIDARKAGDGS